jgi:hypothetical protein
VAEDLAFVQVNGGNACLCAITVSAEGLAVTENPMSTEELLAAIKVISKGVTIDRCFVDMVSTADVPQKAASGLFDLIDSHRWQCQITIHEDLPSNEFDGSRLGLLWNTPKHFRWPLPTFLKSQALLKTYRI